MTYEIPKETRARIDPRAPDDPELEAQLSQSIIQAKQNPNPPRTSKATLAATAARRHQANERKAAHLREQGYFVIRQEAVTDPHTYLALYEIEKEFT